MCKNTYLSSFTQTLGPPIMPAYFLKKKKKMQGTCEFVNISVTQSGASEHDAW